MTGSQRFQALTLLAVLAAFSGGCSGCGGKKITVPSQISVAIDPPTASMVTGEMKQFKAIVTGTEKTQVTWSISEGSAGGYVDDMGMYTAPALAGTFHLVATSTEDTTASRTAIITVSQGAYPQGVKVAIAPPEAMLTPGQQQAFAAAVVGTDNPAVIWSVQEAGGGTINSLGTYTAPQALGTYHVLATSVANPGVSAVALVHVNSAMGVVVTISPTTVTLGVGQSRQFGAAVTGAANSLVTWTVDEIGGGIIGQGGDYTAPLVPGTYHVTATSQAAPMASAKATVTVVPVEITISPTSATLETGEAKAFTAIVTGTTDLAVNWLVQEGVVGGSVTAGGVYTASSTPGTYHVIAQAHADASKTAVATITVIPTVVVTVSPSPVQLFSSQTQQFSASVNGTPTTAVTWSIAQGAAGGTITAGGLYNAPVAGGTYTVMATTQASPIKSGSATVTVIPGIGVTVSPPQVTLSVGTTQTFTATVTGTAVPTVTWSVLEGSSGGSVTAGGVYTAPTKTGTYHVVATSTADTSRKGTATVTVVGVPVSLGGTVTYTGTRTGRIFIRATTSNFPDGVAGTSLAAKGPFTIRGFQGSGDVTVSAFMDTTNTGTYHPTIDPVGSVDVTVSGSNVTGLTVELKNPSAGLPGDTSLTSVIPTDYGALFMYSRALDWFGTEESADRYRVYWSNLPNPGPSNQLGSKTILATAQQMGLISGVVNGQALYFSVAAVNNGWEGSTSAGVGPVTIGTGTGGLTLTGQVSFTGVVPTGPLYVLAQGPNGKALAKFAVPASPQSYSLSGLAAGTYSLYAFFDAYGDGELTVIDPNTFAKKTQVQVTTSMSAPLLTIPNTDSWGKVTTRHDAEVNTHKYEIAFGVYPNLKRPVTVALASGPKVAAPIDLALDWASNAVHVGPVALGSTAPLAGDTYTFNVTYSDGSTGTLTAQVTAVLAAPTLVSPVGTGSTTPNFTWSAPNPQPPEYIQYFRLYNLLGGIAGHRDNVPSYQTSLLYSEINSTSQTLTTFLYSWAIYIYDPVGNSSSRRESFLAN